MTLLDVRCELAMGRKVVSGARQVQLCVSKASPSVETTLCAETSRVPSLPLQILRVSLDGHEEQDNVPNSHLLRTWGSPSKPGPGCPMQASHLPAPEQPCLACCLL